MAPLRKLKKNESGKPRRVERRNLIFLLVVAPGVVMGVRSIIVVVVQATIKESNLNKSVFLHYTCHTIK